uniref:NADH-ubiquinone oxidoreductase chain 3 n=1 Tax=Chlamydosaurus kingii TaxID=103699 RepID=A4KVX7_CHLKI|nr:NADH dehydrogenase subunit 3 [Chlamydosaurus kingii]ABK53971.1 NADH dehydrogenase subunit 3 [Chlamydosaurus kingii]ABK53984.1 NADH dehydrogenase subunit 3 [Chlamydosaurus kingii]ABK53997.1 NADH dehydrogenase subunit 3 [Chlamydosaurus kingii]
MTPATILMILAALPQIMMMAIILLPPKSTNLQKTSPYECGFDPFGNSRLPFSLQFFLIAIFFLLFDLEIALLLPMPWATNTAPTHSTIWALSLLTLLAIGLAYEWAQGALEWSK